ncbi:MAG: nitroreductase family protein [Thermoplasmata archaeon]|nr:MAG: nitroreductase family protein [Thermoplasmata archaeon]
MELAKAIKSRRSIRSFTPDVVDDSVIRKIIEFGNLAPSAGNLQPRDFIVVKDKNIKFKLAQAALDQHFVYEAPVVIVVCANLQRAAPYGSRGKELYCIQDSAAAAENMLLAIVDFGLASCWVGAFNEKAVSEVLGLPSHVRPVALLPVGHPKEQVKSSYRINLTELIHWDSW